MTLGNKLMLCVRRVIMKAKLAITLKKRFRTAIKKISIKPRNLVKKLLRKI
jgi:hypothetical protein